MLYLKKNPKLKASNSCFGENQSDDITRQRRLHIAMDSVGGWNREVVFYVAGSSSRMTAVTEGKPSDATIVAIVDAIEIKRILRLSKDQIDNKKRKR